MFGLRLKSWMEAHLGRPRQKSSHQNQKSRVSKDVPDGGGGTSSTTGAAAAGNTATAVTTGALLSSSNGNPHPANLREQDSKLDSSPSSDFFTTTSPSSSSVQIQSRSEVVQTAQLQKQEPPTKDYEEKLQEHHHQRSTCTRSSTTGSVVNSTSHNILLGSSFCNNLSSPDTGYGSTDGYSPKSVYPALSFESSGKSTPKSCYTISSLVSSELHLNSSKHTTSLSSASCSVNNGLESDQDHECASPRLLKTSASLPPHSESDRSNSNLGLGNGSRNSQDSSSIDKHPNQVLAHSHSINQESKFVRGAPVGQDGIVGNDTVRSTQCNPTKLSVVVVNHPSEFSSHQSQGESSMVAAKHSLSNFSSQSRQDSSNETCNPDDFSKSSNPFCNSNQIQSSPSPSDDHNLHNQKRTETTDERKSTITTLSDSEGGSNSSSVLTAPGNRNIRTQFVLVTTTTSTTTATSQIPECNGFGLKNAFSICSPRKERTRIKTNPWIKTTTLNQYTTNPNDGNSNANPGSDSVIKENGTGAVLRKSCTPPMQSESIGMEKAKMNFNSTLIYSNSDNPRNIGVDLGENSVEITNKGAGNRIMDHQVDSSSNLLYRISTSTSASDSGKGSLDPGTNRNSTESSCLLSDSASTRNSIISHEAELECSESRSSIGSVDTCSNGHGSVLSPPNKLNQKCNERKQYTPEKVNKVVKTVSSAQDIPAYSKKCGYKVRNKYNDTFFEPNSEQDATSSASITLPLELITTSASSHANVVMVDKETDILSDWANTDEDGEDEIETDKNDDDDEDRVTPTPSSPDTDTGGRVIFHNSQSTGSVTDIDFGDSSAATAASSTGIAPSSIFRPHYTQNVNKNSKAVASDPYHHHNNIIMNPPTTCYQPIQIIPTVHNFNVHDNANAAAAWNQSDTFGNPTLVHHQPPTDVLGLTQSGIMCPSGHAVGIPHANISLSSLYSNGSEHTDYNANKPQSSSSNAIARGALGFLRKMFKKGSCSSHRTSPGSDKIKMPRSSKSKDSHLDNIASITGLRSSLLTADALVSPHPLVARKQSIINGYFLTPTPNAFRRRSGTGTDSSDSKSSKHLKSVKTDVIRLPQGALSPTQQGHQTYLQNSSSSTSSSKNASIGAFCISTLQNNTFASSGHRSNNNHGYLHTNSSTSSIHSMSTSTSVTSTGAGEIHANGQTPRQNQSRLNDNFYLNSNSTRQSPFMSNQHQQHNAGTVYPHSTAHAKPQPPTALPPVPPRSPNISQTSQSQISHRLRERDFLVRPSSRTGPCPNDSPRLQNPQHGVNSPSFNNYSPIHRLVVTGGNHLLNRCPSNPSGNTINCASPSPHLISRNGDRERFPSTSHSSSNNNNNPSTFTSNINRSAHPASSPSLINHHHHHHHQSISSPRPHIPFNTHTFTSPSPILRNPKYQYITSSNQNSPVLNAPRRINVPTPTPTPTPPPNQQHYYYHNQGRGGGPFPNPNPNGPPPSFSTFSPTPPPRQAPQTNNNNNPFSTASPNLNHHHHQLHSQNSSATTTSHITHCSSSSNSGREFEMVNSPNLHRGLGNNPSLSANNRNNILSRSQSYQAHQAHYYASPVVAPQSQRIIPHPLAVHPTSLTFNEPPLLMKAHLHNQNVRLNNFLMNKQRHHQQSLTNETAGRFPNSESFQERIYETVDSADDDDEEEHSNEKLSIHHQHQNGMRNQCYYPNTNGFSTTNREQSSSSSREHLPTVISNPESGFPYSNKSNTSTTHQNSKSKRSKAKPPSSQSLHAAETMSVCQPQRPPVPMALFGPNTFLSETETILMLEADREADRKYKRLINEAEALLREITAVKSQQPWVHREQERLHADSCPQSDPLKRKAYDCWALRRLQQELAGCCASPPVLHRSRMNLQSPSTPTGANMQPYFIPNLSVDPNSQFKNVAHIENNNPNAHF